MARHRQKADFERVLCANANRRHIGPSAKEIAEMLALIGVPDLHALIDATVPQSIRQTDRIDFGKSLSERRALDKLRETANKNLVLTSLIGQGYRALGYVLIAVYVLPLMTIGIWRLTRRRSTPVETV